MKFIWCSMSYISCLLLVNMCACTHNRLDSEIQIDLASNIDLLIFFFSYLFSLPPFSIPCTNYFAHFLVINSFLLCESGHFRHCQINVWSKNIPELCSGFPLLVDIPGMLPQFLEKSNWAFQSHLTGMTVVGACICYWFNNMENGCWVGPFALKWVLGLSSCHRTKCRKRTPHFLHQF